MENRLINKRNNTFQYHDIENGIFTIFPVENGGAIISGTTIKEANFKFEKAMKLSIAIRKFLFYK